MSQQPKPATPQSAGVERLGYTIARLTLHWVCLSTALCALATPRTLKAGAAPLPHQQLATHSFSPTPTSPANLSEHEIEEIGSMPAQQQAERLLERATNHYSGALELIQKYVDHWYGELKMRGNLNSLVNAALNSNDLHVRGAALEVMLLATTCPSARKAFMA